MKLNFEGMEKIGEGEEKEVYIHPQDESKVLSRFKYEASHTEREMKGAMIKNYNREKILEASDTLDEAAREKIKIYLDRLDILFEEERTEKNYI